ncbi:MAG TPA: transporter [Casimicrobiaceae bacterium]|nr:transporter [Casimicrobiaceae bacterium]
MGRRKGRAPRPHRILNAVPLLIAAVLAPEKVHAGAPFQTDDPGVVARGGVELLVFSQQTLAADGRSGVLPGVELHYGAAENVELDLVAPIAFHSPKGEGARRGYGDTQLGLKYGLLEEREALPEIGFAPKLLLPTGNADRGLGNGGTAVYLPIWLQKNLGDLRTYGGGGYWINRGSGNRNYWFVGAEAQYRFSDRWMLGAEIFHTTPTRLDERASTGFNVGGAYAIDPRAQWLFSIGKGLQNVSQTNRVSGYLGYQASY